MFRIMLFIFTGLFSQFVFSQEMQCENTDKNNIVVEKAFYVGKYIETDDRITSDLFYKDFFCAEKFLKEKYKGKKFLTIFGSSSIKKTTDPNRYNASDNDKIYEQTYSFAKLWAEKYGSEYPILTGAGPGLMEAAARGALDGKGVSIGYTTYFGDARKNSDASLAFQKYDDGPDKGKPIITDGLIFSSISVRETLMILHSAAIVIVPGGSGTNWEIFQTIEMLKSNQLTSIPVYFLGERTNWVAYESYINDMVARGVIKEKDRENFVRFVDTPEELLELLSNDKRLFPEVRTNTKKAS